MKIISSNLFSKIYKQYFSDIEFQRKFFPSNFNNIDELNRDFGPSKRTVLHQLIQNTMSAIELSPQQNTNLELLADSDTYTVVTGQQAGFLGGPLYTFYKIQTAINYSEKFNLQSERNKFVPIFWVEDNDHDLLEAAKAYFINKDSEIEEVLSHNISNNKNPICNLKYEKETEEIKNVIIEKLQSGRYREEATALINEVYYEGAKINKAFIKLLNKFFSNSGLLFISGSEAVQAGLMQDIAQKEIETIGQTRVAIQKASSEFIESGFELQANIQTCNLFYLNKGQREKIHYNEQDLFFSNEKKWTKEELIIEVKSSPNLFSPNVLLRPILQDSILPTAAYIAGPGETAYFCQLKYLYEFYSIPMPQILNRLHITLIDKKTGKLLNTEDISYSFLLRDYSIIEKELLAKFDDMQEINTLNLIESKISDLLDEAAKICAEYDGNLNNTAAGTKTTILKNFKHLQQKLSSSVKRNNDALFNKYKYSSNFIFPKNGLQERFYSPINILCEIGIDRFINMLNSTKQVPVDEMNYIEIDY